MIKFDDEKKVAKLALLGPKILEALQKPESDDPL